MAYALLNNSIGKFTGINSGNLIADATLNVSSSAGQENITEYTIPADCFAQLQLRCTSTYTTAVKLWIDGVAIRSIGSSDTAYSDDWFEYCLTKGTVIGVSAYHSSAAKSGALNYKLWGLKR